jgi:TRAP-type mannitol/chloroaromatic compound transport system substrate-binding protein
MTFVARLKAMAGAAAAAALLSLAPGAQAQEHSFTMATSWAGGPLMEIGAQAFANRVKEMSGGRIVIEVFPAGTLGEPLKVTETVSNGLADMGHTWIGYDWGVDPTVVLFGGYAGSFDTERMLHWMYRGGGAEMQREYRMEKFGVVSMPLFIRTAEVFLHSIKPVRTLADLQGLKIRTAGAWLEMLKQLGAAPVTTPGGEIYTALERGTIDATEWGTLWENISPGFYKVAKYLIIPGVHQPTAPFELSVNKDVWASLSAEDQALIENAARLTTFDSWLTIGQEDAKALDFYRAQGNEIIELEPEVQYAVKDIAIAWADGVAANNVWFARVLESQRAFEALWANANRYRNVLVKAQ